MTELLRAENARRFDAGAECMNRQNIIPDKNVDWRDVKLAVERGEDVTIIDRGTVFVANRDGAPWALVFWSSGDARQAQRWLYDQIARQRR